MEPLAPGDPARIGPFRLVARLGRGGMGRVYLARAESTGRAVAIKTIHGELLADAEFRTRFSHEVAAARRVRDEYIAEVVDADPDGQTPWLATAYVPGISVEDAVRRFGPLPAESVRVLGLCVARAVAAIHAVGLVHRDLKPANVLLTNTGPKVIDFGIARGVADVGLTKTGMVSGSPPYMAPEQLTHGTFSPGSDVFSLGAILHYAATAAGPYGRGGAQEQYARALAVGPVLDPALPDSLTEVINRCFVADPTARPFAGEAAHLLEAHEGERPTPGWLPSAVVTEILTQATDALNTDSAAGASPPPAPAAPMPPPPLIPPPAHGPGPMPYPGGMPPRPAPSQQPGPPPRQGPPQQGPPPRPQPTPPRPQPVPPRSQTPPPFAPPGQHPNTPPPFATPSPQPNTPRPNTPPPFAMPGQQPNTPRPNTPPPFAAPSPQPNTPRPNTPPPNAPRPNTPRPNTPLPNTPRPNTPLPNRPYPNPNVPPYPNAPYSGTPPRPYPAQPPYPYAPGPAGVPYGYGRPPTATDNGMAVTALVLALVGIAVPCLLPIALPFGFIGLSKANTLGTGRAQAMAGTIIAAVLIAGWIILIAVLATSS